MFFFLYNLLDDILRNVGFVNITPGIKNETVFDVPKDCTEVSKRVAPDNVLQPDTILVNTEKTILFNALCLCIVFLQRLLCEKTFLDTFLSV